MDETMEEVREYRRRDFLRRKKLFQSSTTDEGGGFEVPARVAGVGSDRCCVVVEA
jgi:hypothetical protein